MDHLQNFNRKAAQWGHSLQALQAGEQVDTYFTIDDFYVAREIISNATPAQRKLRQASFFHPDLMLRGRLGQGVHDRCEAIAFADGILSERDRAGLELHLPLRLKATSIARKVVRAGETWNVTVSPHHWGLDDREDVYRLLNIGTLILEPGSSIAVEGNVFSMLVQDLRTPTHCPPEMIPQIRIMPTPYSVDFGHGPLHGMSGIEGKSGEHGAPGIIPQLGSTILGMYMNGEYSHADLSGKHGATGEKGTHGLAGRNGGMCKLAEITLQQLSGPLLVTAQAGTGGNGGAGGPGGNGGNGGGGTPAYRLYTGWSTAGDGGNGGDAGHGGHGGKGGNGGISSNIYLSVPEECKHYIGIQAWASLGGKGGKAGPAGQAGNAGNAGAGPEPGKEGQVGNPAISGKDGRDGHPRNPALVFLNEEPQNLAETSGAIPWDSIALLQNQLNKREAINSETIQLQTGGTK